MYNRNYGGFVYVRIYLELLKLVLNRKVKHINAQLTLIRDRYPQNLPLHNPHPHIPIRT